MKILENPLKVSVGRKGKETFTIVEVCKKLGMSRPTLMKFLKQKGVKPMQSGRGGKMWFTGQDLERLQNGK